MPLLKRLLLAAIVLLALAAPARALAQEEGPVYIVQEGDTLIGIALRFGVGVDALASANGLSDPSSIFPGMALRLPGYEGISGVLQTLPVGAGETSAAWRCATVCRMMTWHA
jgi:LysM repeat protein